MSVATFDDTMATLVCEIDDRKIYNDIRSQIDVTVTEVITDEPIAVVATGSNVIHYELWKLTAGETRDFHLSAVYSHRPVTWGVVEAVGRPFYPVGDPFGMTVTILDSDTESIYLRIVNDETITIIVDLSVAYTYQYISGYSEQSHEETNIKTITVRTTDETSVSKYGRRVMNLTWPLGQTQQQMESLIAGYLELYKDPRPYLYMTVLGTTDALIVDIFTIKVSDRVTIINSGLGINEDFFVNSINISKDSDSLLIGNYVLEEIPTMQSESIFTWDTSEWDGPDIWGW